MNNQQAYRGNASGKKNSQHAPRGKVSKAGKPSYATPTPFRVALLMALGLAGSLAFDAVSIPQASANSPKRAEKPLNRDSRSTIATRTPAVDEFTIGKRAVQMTRTTGEIHSLVSTLPGPGLTKRPGTQTEPTYADPYEEMLARLQHAATLLAETTAILQAMPTPRTVTPPAPPPAAVAPEAPKAESLPAVEEAAPAEVNREAEEKSPLSAMTLTRLAMLLLGALFAIGLIKYLPRLFRAKNGEKRTAPPPPSKAIEPPPLNDHALELADIMASMGLTDGAAHALVEHIRKNPKQALSYWLKLLAVYRQAGKQTEFEQTAELMRTNYNIRPDAWTPPEHDNESPVSLEHYPHIAAQLKKLWPKPECSDYLLSLLGDNREGRREGFPLPVVEEIVLLLAMLRTENG